MNNTKTEGKLGVGSFGSVYLVSSQGNNTKFAFKVITLGSYRKDQLSFSDYSRFNKNISELLLINSSLSHKNILSVESANVNSHTSNSITTMNAEIWFPYCERGNLHDFISHAKKQKKYLPEKDIINFSIQLLEALQYAHNKNIIHRNLKPRNILLTTQNNQFILKLCDFGL